MDRKPTATKPSTYTIAEVISIFQGKLEPQTLGTWDKLGIFKPSYYALAGAKGGLISPRQLENLRNQRGKNKGDPRRRYSYDDLVRLAIFLYVKAQLDQRKVPNSSRRAAEIMEQIHGVLDDDNWPLVWPSGARIIMIGQRKRVQAYLLERDGTAKPLTKGGQMVMIALLTDTASGEVRGRVAALAIRKEIRQLPIEDTEALASA